MMIDGEVLKVILIGLISLFFVLAALSNRPPKGPKGRD